MKRIISILFVYLMGVTFLFSLSNRVKNIDETKIANNYNTSEISYNE